MLRGTDRDAALREAARQQQAETEQARQRILDQAATDPSPGHGTIARPRS